MDTLPQVKGYRTTKGNLPWAHKSDALICEAIRARYRRARKAGKAAILDEFCAVCRYHRKYALGLLRTPGKRSKPSGRKPGPVSRYATPEL